MLEDLYRNAMDGIFQKVALQEIRKVIRGNKPEGVKLELIATIIHSYEDDVERAELEAERRAIEADEEALRHEKIDEMFEDMAPPFDKLIDIAKGKAGEKK